MKCYHKIEDLGSRDPEMSIFFDFRPITFVWLCFAYVVGTKVIGAFVTEQSIPSEEAQVTWHRFAIPGLLQKAESIVQVEASWHDPEKIVKQDLMPF